MKLPSGKDLSSQYIAALYYLGVHEMLDTAPAVSLIQSIANHSGHMTLASVLGGTASVIGEVYRETQELDKDHDLFVQVMWDDWENRNVDPIYFRSLQFLNAGFNMDPEAARMVWLSVVTEESTPEEDTEFLFRLLEDLQEVMNRMMDADEEEE